MTVRGRSTAPSATASLWYVVLHDGASGRSNVKSFDRRGALVSSTVLDPSVPLEGLRGVLLLFDGYLLVCNQGAVLRFAAARSPTAPRSFLGAFTQVGPRNPGLLRPFNAVLGPDENLYVANQGDGADPSGTNAVTRYFGPGTRLAGTPMPPPPTAVPYPGSFVPPKGVGERGVSILRDLLFAPDGFLYVADEGRDEVRRYDARTGAFEGCVLTAADGLRAPVHLLLSPHGTHLYVGSSKNNQVLRCSLATGSVHPFVLSDAGLDATAGMAFGGDGWLYVASRRGRQILRFREMDGAPDDRPFIDADALGDNPEFILPVTVPAAA